MRKIIIRSLFFSFFLISSTLVRAQDVCSSNPKYCKLLADTAGFRMMMITLPPGAKLVMHTHNFHINYVLKGGLFKWTYKSGQTQSYLMKAGEEFHGGADPAHYSWNAGKTVIQYIHFEKKE